MLDGINVRICCIKSQVKLIMTRIKGIVNNVHWRQINLERFCLHFAIISLFAIMLFIFNEKLKNGVQWLLHG